MIRGEPWDDGTFFDDGTGWVERMPMTGHVYVEPEAKYQPDPALSGFDHRQLRLILRKLARDRDTAFSLKRPGDLTPYDEATEFGSFTWHGAPETDPTAEIVANFAALATEAEARQQAIVDAREAGDRRRRRVDARILFVLRALVAHALDPTPANAAVLSSIQDALDQIARDEDPT